ENTKKQIAHALVRGINRIERSRASGGEEPGRAVSQKDIVPLIARRMIKKLANVQVNKSDSRKVIIRRVERFPIGDSAPGHPQGASFLGAQPGPSIAAKTAKKEVVKHIGFRAEKPPLRFATRRVVPGRA